MGAVAEFLRERITPETAGKTLQLTFWDMADIGGQSAASSDCRIQGITTANYNGRNVIVMIRDPARLQLCRRRSGGMLDEGADRRVHRR